MTTPALNIPIRADLGKFQQDMERAGTVATKALNQIAKNSATVAQNLLAMRQAAVAFEALRFVGVGRSLMPLSLAIAAVTGTFKLMSYATELATQRIAEFDKISKNAAASGVSTDFFQRITKASEATRLSIDDATKALKRFGEVSTDKLNGSEIASRLAELTKAGNFQGNKGRAAFEGAATTEEKYRAIVKLIEEALTKGERLAALDLAEKAFGKDVTDRLRANSSYLTEMLASADKMAATKLISDIDVGNALDLKRRMEEAEKILSERWRPVQDDLAKLGANYHASMVGITETMASAVGFANQIYAAIKEIPGVFERAGNASFWDKLREWSESKGLNSRPEGLVLRGEPGFEQNTTADSPAMRQLRAGLQNQAAVAKAMREASDHVSKVYGDLSKRTDEVAKKTRDVNDEFDRATNTVNRHIARMEADVRAVGLGAGAMEAFRTKALLMAAAQQAGIPITAKLTAQIDKQAEAAGRAARELARARAASEIEFDQETMFLSPDELRIAQELRAIYGNDIPAALGSSEAAAMRLNNTMRGIKDTVIDSAKSFTSDLISGLREGKGLMDSLANAARNLSASLTNSALNSLFSGNFLLAGIQGLGALVSGLLGGSGDKRRQAVIDQYNRDVVNADRVYAANDNDPNAIILIERKSA